MGQMGIRRQGYDTLLHLRKIRAQKHRPDGSNSGHEHE